jgi:hypothetical protein
LDGLLVAIAEAALAGSSKGDLEAWERDIYTHLIMQGIFNRPPSIAEDTIQYALYPPESNSDRTSVTSLALAIQHFVDSLLTDFLWHRDFFQVKVVQDSDRSGWFLEGRMRVGDSIDDEWCVVWLLRQVSEKWDITIR